METILTCLLLNDDLKFLAWKWRSSLESKKTKMEPILDSLSSFIWIVSTGSKEMPFYLMALMASKL